MIILTTVRVLGILLLVLLLVGAWRSVREGEPRAAAILFAAALIVPAPFVLAGAAPPEYRTGFAVMLLVAVGLGVFVLLLPGGAPPIGDDRPRTRIDERDIMFSRNLLEPGTERFREYYRANPERRAPDDVFRARPGLMSRGASAWHPLGFPAADASFRTIERLRPFVDGEPSTERAPVDAEAATAFLLAWIRKLGAVSVGVTTLEPYHLYTTVGRGPDYGESVRLAHRFAIALTVEMDRRMVASAPLAPTLMESAQQYVASGVIAVQAAAFIRGLGYPARAHIDGNYRVICPLVARDAAARPARPDRRRHHRPASGRGHARPGSDRPRFLPPLPEMRRRLPEPRDPDRRPRDPRRRAPLADRLGSLLHVLVRHGHRLRPLHGRVPGLTPRQLAPRPRAARHQALATQPAAGGTRRGRALRPEPATPPTALVGGRGEGSRPRVDPASRDRA
jgi:hypothetical protein